MTRRFLTHSLNAALAVVALLGATGCSVENGSHFEARSGTLDLRGADLDDPVALAGIWSARVAKEEETVASILAAPESSWRTARVPGSFAAQGFADEGTVWYRLKLRLPSTASSVKGFVQHANNAHALYAVTAGRTARLLAASGRPASDAGIAVRSREPVTFTLPGDNSVVLLWKVANVDFLHGGPLHAIQLGTVEGIDRMLLRKVSTVFALFGVFMLVFVSFLVSWWMRRSEVEALAVSLLALVMAVRAPVAAGALEYLFPLMVDFEIRILFEAATILVMPALLGLLFWGYFPYDMQPVRFGRFALIPSTAPSAPVGSLPPTFVRQRPAPRSLRILNTTLVVVAVGFGVITTAIAVLSGSGTTSYVLAVARWVHVALGVGAVVLLGQVLYRRRPQSVAVASGVLFLLATGIHALLGASGEAGSFGPGGLVQYGFLAFLLAQTYALVRRYGIEARTARKRMAVLREDVEMRTRELRAASIAVHAANLAKSHFLSAVSHELRSPLASILGYTRILHEELEDALEPQHAEFFDTIRASGERLTGLVNDILDVAKIEAGMLDLTFSPVELRHLANDVLDQVYPLSREKGLAVRVEFGTEDAFVLADVVRLRQVLLNLVSNAIKFTRSGEIVVSIGEETLGEDSGWAIAVSDTGPGISPDFLPHVFERFTQEDRLYNETQRGTGLGLSVSRELVARMHGTIAVKSAVDVGSTFTVVLPRARTDASFDSVHPAFYERALQPAQRA